MKLRVPTSLCVLLSLAIPAGADDWPQWMGPQRDNVWREDGLIERFPEGGPPVLWRTPVAGGYAGPAVADGKVFIHDYVSDEEVKGDNFERQEFTGTERVLCLDAQTGEEIWRHEYPVTYTISYPAGPRCTPTVDGGKVYTLGAEGRLIAFVADSGDVVWQHDLPREYNAKTALWGYSAHPLVDGQKLFTVAGGEGSHAVAFNKHTGEEIWRALTSPDQGYSPPVLIEVAEHRQLILLRPNAVSAVDPETGREFWSFPYEAGNGTAIMSPLRWQNYLYMGSYANKSLLLRLETSFPDADILWRDKPQHGVSPINVQPIVDDDGIMYGFDQNGRLYAVELPSGQRLWDTTAPISRRPVYTGTAFIVRQGDGGDRYWLFTENGDLIIARLSRDGYEELDRTHLLAPTNHAFGRDVVWCMPAFAGRRMIVRNDEQCIAVDLAAQ